jgi:hypothetical protein
MSGDWRESRAADFARHLGDLRGGSYEGSAAREDKERTFRHAVDLLAPVAVRVLTAFNETLLAKAGDVSDGGVLQSPDGGLAREWHLSWPGQREAQRRTGPPGPIRPIVVRAHFPPGWTHGHLGGSVVGNWPLQIIDEADAERQELVIWAIAEAEFHERIYESVHPWAAVPAPVGIA